jgi:hypothetical protein
MAKHEVLKMPSIPIPKMEIKAGKFNFNYLNIFLVVAILILLGYLVFKMKQ